jgi:hypothetical protein
MKTKHTPTQDQLDALNAYAAKNGRGWKDRLITSWMQGRCGEYGPVLHGIRNQFGPVWLSKFKPSR